MTKVDYSQTGFVEQLLKDISINPDEMDNEFLQHAGLYSFYAEQARLSANEAEKTRLRMQVERAKLDAYYRVELPTNHNKVTEAMIEAAITIDPKYIAASKQAYEAKNLATLIRDNLEALKQKRDCLVQLNVSRREDMKGTLRGYESSPKTFKDDMQRVRGGNSPAAIN